MAEAFETKMLQKVQQQFLAF